MKDLKHLIYFEKLLQDAQNELVTKAVDEEKLHLATTAITFPKYL